MPDAHVTVVGDAPTGDPVTFVRRPYRRLTNRFVEAAALAWFRDLGAINGQCDWVASLELCALVTAQAGRLARRTGARQVVLTWGNDERNLLYRIPPYRQATKEALRADLFVCLLEAARQHCIALGVDPARCAVVAPPLDTDLFHPPEAPAAEPVIVFASPLEPNKGIDRVLDAFTLARREVPDAKLRVIGRGSLEPLVRAAAERSGGAVELVGWVGPAQLAAELRRGAIFTTAPRPTRVWSEQFGLAYIEAMACGLPVVTTICGTNEEAVRAPNLRVPDHAEALAEGYVTFLTDDARRHRTGERNRHEVVERYERGQQLRRLREAFRDVPPSE